MFNRGYKILATILMGSYEQERLYSYNNYSWPATQEDHWNSPKSVSTKT